MEMEKNVARLMDQVQSVTVIASRKSHRLDYVLDWIFRQQLGLDFNLVLPGAPIPADRFCIVYGAAPLTADLRIPASGLMTDSGIRAWDMAEGTWQGIPVLFTAAMPAQEDMPFDLFSAVFYLLSRYEEYLPFTPDQHGRYPATESILYRMDCLQRPLVDEWLQAFAALLCSRGLRPAQRSFRFLPTYDIDIAWSYLHKGWQRNLGGFGRSLLQGNLSAVRERWQVLRGQATDPFDSFGLLDQLHAGRQQRPVYFILAGLANTSFDKQVLPVQPAMSALIRQLSMNNEIGTHPSYYTAGNKDKAAAEKSILEQITGYAIRCSRQHYIRLSLPGSCRQLLALGICRDYSMGYGTHSGFRAGTSQPFAWYDLELELVTGLQLLPFCFMDATLHFGQQLDAAAAFAVLDGLTDRLQRVGGTLVTVWHNFSLGTDPAWSGWPEAYASWFRTMPDTPFSF